MVFHSGTVDSLTTNAVYTAHMTTLTRNIVLIIIGGIILCGGVAWFLQSQDSGGEREGTQQLTAEQVVDLEVQAEQGGQNR